MKTRSESAKPFLKPLNTILISKPTQSKKATVMQWNLAKLGSQGSRRGSRFPAQWGGHGGSSQSPSGAGGSSVCRVTVAPISCQGGNSPLESALTALAPAQGMSGRREQLPAIHTPVLWGMSGEKPGLQLIPDHRVPLPGSPSEPGHSNSFCRKLHTLKYLKYQPNSFDKFYQLMGLCLLNQIETRRQNSS